MSKTEAKFWPKWDVKIDDQGMVIFEQPELWQSFKIPYRGKNMTLILKDRTTNRSRSEEKYYYGVVVRMVAEEMGISRQSAHQLMAGMFLTVEEKSREGFRYKRVLSTTELTDKRYHNYIFTECIPWASLPTSEGGLGTESGLSLFIPLPNEIDYENS